ncbi:MAG: cation diffusion facilitator family transporter [Pelobium sp.]
MDEKENNISKRTKQEALILKVSMTANLLLAIFAFYYAIKTGSEAIKLDGYYSFAGFILALISLWVVKIIQKPESSNYNFGHSLFEPLFNLIKGVMILAIVLSSAINAIKSLLSGGNNPSFDMSIVYFLIATITCLLLTVLFYKKNNTVPSPIVYVEYKNWSMDTMISASIGAVFITSFYFQNTNYVSWIKYVDPVITLIIIAITLRFPYFTIKTGLKEILLSAPDKDIVERINLDINKVISEYDFDDYNFKATKTGREIYLLVQIRVVNENDALYKLKIQDNVRGDLKRQLDKHFDNIKLDVVFSQNELVYARISVKQFKARKLNNH